MALCEDEGLTEGSHCSVCGRILVAQQTIPALGHDIQHFEAKRPTYTGVGWEAYEACSRCAYTTKVEISMLETPEVNNFEDLITNLKLLEDITAEYVRENPGKDPLALIIKYIRTGVDRYNSGSWGIMAGYEDANFAEYVSKYEDTINSQAEDEGQMIRISSLKNINKFNLPNGNLADIGHVFGTMDITYHNNFGLNHADVAGWAGDLVDLVSLADEYAVSGTLDEMVADITENYLLRETFPTKPKEGTFGQTDMDGDLDGFYIMQQLASAEYSTGDLTALFQNYFTEDLTNEDRAAYFLNKRLNGVSLRADVRNAVYNAYTGNKMVKTLEDTREFTSDDLVTLRRACCYAFADYVCRLAGDFVDAGENQYFEVFATETSTLAPGITQEIKYATSADNKQMVYYVATADLTRDDVSMYANYNNNDPTKWAMSRVLDQANFAQEKYGNPESEHYIENYNVIVSTNGAGYNMSTGEPGGVLVMGGVEYHPINSNGFFGILKDGTPVIGTTEEYNTIYAGKVQEAIACFGATLVIDGEVCVPPAGDYFRDRASRTAVGITRTGKVVLMVLDGRQEPFSCGGSMQEIAQIMLEAGCIHAVNLDGGGSTTYVAKQEGSDTLEVISKPSDGAARSVSTSWMMVSTAPSSTAFDHAILETETNYMTVGSSQKVTAEGVSATGNAAEIPEGTTWAVSDKQWGVITEDGVFTALSNGSGEIQLMQGDTVIGSKIMNVVLPDNVYFTKSKLDSVYGETVELPVKVLYDNKPVTVIPGDLVFTLENESAGVIEGFTFTGNEGSGVKSTKLTVALANDETVKASIVLALYNQGEATFDFDQATGGNRQLAWDRKVSNSTTVDEVTYEIVNADEDMVSSYIFAIDMTQIPIPKQLDDLIYMLPGADMEDASAWKFLLALAQRVSVLTEVKPAIQFDPNFTVDYSNLTLVNEYFDLQKAELNEVTNTLTMTLKWKKQTQAIDPDTANPMCIVSGIKVTPKTDAAWSDKGTLTPVHKGEISYNVYLRASSLYTFAQKPENQETFGLKPFANPDDPSEAGASFGDIYNRFEDTYTLVRVLKNGWVNEDGGFAYYVEGVKHTGIHQIDGTYYDFGESGINLGQTPYTGLLEENGKTYYAKVGKLVTGWQQIMTDWYLFDSKTGAAYDGTYSNFFNNTVTYTFDNGRLTSGVWVQDENGWMYYYGPDRYVTGWKIIDGKQYYFANYYRYEGICSIMETTNLAPTWYEFGEDGALIRVIPDGLFWHEGSLYYILNAETQRGLHYVDGYYYYFRYSGQAATGTYYVTNSNGLMPNGYYKFDDQGRMIIKNGFVQEEDGIYYYEDGQLTYAGLICVDGFYYYVNSSCKVVTGNYYVTKNNDLMPSAYYNFDAQGRMIIPGHEYGFIEENGGLYYYVDGVRTPAGLVYEGGYYYYVDEQARAVTGTYYVTKHNDLLPSDYYNFDEQGRMIIPDGLFAERDGIYYYQNRERYYAGLIYVDGYYYYIGDGGKAVTGTYYVIKNNDLLPSDSYEFDDQGRMIIPDGFFVEKDGTYYYKNGQRNFAGLILVDEYYYYIDEQGKMVTGTYYVSKHNDLLPSDTYEFDEQGRMIIPEEPDAPVFSRSMQAFLTLESEVYLNVAYTFEDLAELNPEEVIARSGLLVWDAAEMPAEEDAVYENCGQIYNQTTFNAAKNRFEVRTPGIPAKELGDGICFRAYYQLDDGSYIYGRIISNYSPKKYCYGQLKDASTADDALMVAILNYGAGAQNFFEYELDNLMNADLTEEQKALHWDGSLVRSDWSVPVEKEGSLVRNKTVVTSRGGYLSLLGAIDYNYYVKISSNVTVAKAEMLIWNEADYNKADVLTEENATSVHTMEYKTEKSRYEFKYRGLAAKEMFHPVYACAKITDDAGNVYYSGVVAYSPERYAYISSTSATATAAEAELAKRLVIYGDAARAFFG